jgi:7-cyano-7-deazaguanine synthase in queuosine biosynthesis
MTRHLKSFQFGVNHLFNIWINKQEDDIIELGEGVKNPLLFNLFDKNNKSNVKTDVEQLWRRFGVQSLSEINEDFLLIAISVFCADKRIPRKKTIDNWTRRIKLHIPVLEIDKWNAVKNELERTLGFLSGDEWLFEFRKSTLRFRSNKKNTKYKLIGKEKFDSVSLFSGGLDSFCGALTLSEQKKNTCYVGFREYNLLTNRQNELFADIDKSYPGLNKELILFNANPLAPLQRGDDKEKLAAENTSRSRSFLFIAGAVSIASLIGEDTPVYIPENGFIGVNVPLTDSRNGSCSTRTTHPIFLKSLNRVFQAIGLKHTISNFYWDKSKGEIVKMHRNNTVFLANAHRTLSCSHPCLSRYDRKHDKNIEIPCNCGYCYPCLIRRSSLLRAHKDNTNYNSVYNLNGEFISKYNNLQGRASDLKALLYSLRRYNKYKNDREYIRMLLLRQGPLDKYEIDSYEQVYHKSMHELLEMFLNEDAKKGGGLIDYLGLKELVENGQVN